MSEQHNADIRELFVKLSHHDEKLTECVSELKETRTSLESIKLEIAAFRAKWSVLAVVGSALVSAAISLLFKVFSGGTH